MTRRLLSHARGNAVAYLALFVALGGTSYAAIKLPRNSVGATQIKSSAVRSAEVKDRSLLAKDFKRGQLPAGARGATGLQGAPGAKGETGAQGAPGTTIVARARFAGDMVANFSQEPAALTGAAWTQGATELDQFFGVATLDVPSTQQCGANKVAVILVRLGGAQSSPVVLQATLDSDDYPDAETVTVPLQPAADLPHSFEPGQDTARTLGAYFSDVCGANGHFRLRELKVDVVGVR